MSRNEFLDNLRGKVIDNIDFVEIDGKMIIKTIITDDGYHYNIENEQFSHPIYEKEKTDFIEKLSNTQPSNVFEFRAKHLSLDEMRAFAHDHSKTVNANGGNVTESRFETYLVRMGEDLAELRRVR